MKRLWKISTTIIIVVVVLLANRPAGAATTMTDMYYAAKDRVTSATGAVSNAVSTAKEKVAGAVETARTTISTAVATGIHYLNNEHTAIRINPYKEIVAKVRVGNELCPEERAYREKRKPRVKAAFERLLGRSLDGKSVPTVAIVSSGGGYRAMLGNIGSSSALSKLGIMDTATYIAALSGSTWAVSTWYSTNASVETLRDYIQKTIEKDIHISTIGEAKNIINMIAVKLAFDEPITLVDVYGGLLGNRLLNMFGSDCQRVYLSQQVERIKNADLPFPIYTAIDAREAVSREPHWFEYTPYEIGAPYFGVYVPTWAYGRQFNEGLSSNFAPEQSLGFLMGTWGSAFGVHFGRAWDEVMDLVPSSTIRKLVDEHLLDRFTGKRISATWAEIFNFMYGMPGQELAERKTIKFVDAGIDFNLPYPPISGERPERKADIMIFLDFSGGSMESALRKTEEYARRKGLKFPQIDYTDLKQKTMSVFKDPSDPSVPLVIYFPRMSDAQLWQENKSNPAYNGYQLDGFDFDKCTNETTDCATGSFKYAHDLSQQLINQMEFNILVNKDKIIDELNWAVDNLTRFD